VRKQDDRHIRVGRAIIGRVPDECAVVQRDEIRFAGNKGFIEGDADELIHIVGKTVSSGQERGRSNQRTGTPDELHALILKDQSADVWVRPVVRLAILDRTCRLGQRKHANSRHGKRQ
jgi:hypothetical protein